MDYYTSGCYSTTTFPRDSIALGSAKLLCLATQSRVHVPKKYIVVYTPPVYFLAGDSLARACS